MLLFSNSTKQWGSLTPTVSKEELGTFHIPPTVGPSNRARGPATTWPWPCPPTPAVHLQDPVGLGSCMRWPLLSRANISGREAKLETEEVPSLPMVLAALAAN